MAAHAKTPTRAVIDPLCVFLTLLWEYLRIVRNVSAGRHAWKPLPEVDDGATEEFAAVLRGWNADPPTRRLRPVWPVVDPDQAADTRVLPAVEEVTV